MESLDGFIESCRTALKSSHSRQTLEKILAEVLRDPSLVNRLFEHIRIPTDFDRATIKDVTLYADNTLTITKPLLPPRCNYSPHNHAAWAIVGVYDGEEENIFFQEQEDGNLIETHRRHLKAGEVLFMDESTIHSVSNPLNRMSYGIHIYGANLISNWAERNVWSLENKTKKPCGPNGVTLRD